MSIRDDYKPNLIRAFMWNLYESYPCICPMDRTISFSIYCRFCPYSVVTSNIGFGSGLRINCVFMTGFGEHGSYEFSNYHTYSIFRNQPQLFRDIRRELTER